MTIRRSAIALLTVAILGGCASIGLGSGGGAPDRATFDTAGEELALLRLAEQVEAASREIPGLRLEW